MTKPFPTSRSALSRILASAAMLTALAACVAPADTMPKGHVYQETNPLQVAREQVTITVQLPAVGAALSSTDERRLKVFVRDFVQRGRTAITVEAADSARALAVLTDNGVRSGEVVIATDSPPPAPHAVLTFSANAAIVPPCTDWSSRTSFDPENKPHSNYGCSAQRNLGLSVSDPSDLLQAQPKSGTSPLIPLAVAPATAQ